MSDFSRRDFLSRAAVGGAFAAMASSCSHFDLMSKFGEKRKNVLFIAVDDLRPELGCYGVTRAKTPNIDRLAARGTVFNRAYCQQAVCSPSRSSLMTGLRPDTIQVHDLHTHFRLNKPDAVTLAQHFMNNGYHSQGLSKIYHGSLNDPLSWTVPFSKRRVARQ